MLFCHFASMMVLLQNLVIAGTEGIIEMALNM